MVEVNLYFFSVVSIDLHVLCDYQLTEGAMRSGRSLPANPILVLSEPTSIIRGMP